MHPAIPPEILPVAENLLQNQFSVSSHKLAEVIVNPCPILSQCPQQTFTMEPYKCPPVYAPLFLTSVAG